MTKIKCKLCKTVVESRYRNEMRYCRCGEIFIDGGEDYLRYGAGDINNVEVVEEPRCEH